MKASALPDKIITELHCCRGTEDPALSTAARKALEQNPTARQFCETQAEFDAELQRLFRSVTPPTDLAVTVFSSPHHPKSHRVRHFLVQPGFWAVVLSVLVLLGYFVFRTIGDKENFAGSDAARAILRDCSRLDGSEFEAFQGQAELLGDWFFLNHGLEDFTLPQELAQTPAAGCRVFQIEGIPVAQTLFTKPSFIASTVRAKDFHFELPAGSPWRLLTEGEWAGAVCQQGPRVTILALRGERKDMEKLIRKLDPGSSPKAQ